MKIQLKLSNLHTLKPQLLVVFAAQTSSQKKKNEPVAWTNNPNLKKRVSDGAEDKVFEAKTGEAYCFRDANVDGIRHVVAAGLGDEKKISIETVRRTAGQAFKVAKAQKSTSIGILFPPSLPKGLDARTVAQAITEGVLLASYTFDTLKSEKKADSLTDIYLITESKGANKGVEAGINDGTIMGESINFARWLGDMPGNLMTPVILADETVKAAKGTGVKVTVWDKARIRKEKMGCLLGVSLGSAEEPRFIIMEYKGAGASQKPVCYVGKGLTFDSGGISIKPSANMEEMKYDMCGGANVIATVLAIARLKLKVNVVGLVASTENMPGPHANKPGDVLTARNGKTIEVNNTDAEGRLILADALSYACELKPQFIVDAATLTGAVVIALGDTHTGYFCRDKKFTEKINKSAEASGEWIWQLPLVDEHYEDMKGAYADMSNISSNKGAGSAHGAAFLEQFVDKEIPWAHFDIAGTAWNTGHRIAYNPKKGATGVMIRTFVELAK